jgi:hypothetical protein
LDTSGPFGPALVRIPFFSAGGALKINSLVTIKSPGGYIVQSSKDSGPL